MESLLWERVGELADRAPQISDLQHHKLHLLAAARMRERGEHVPVALRMAERHAAAITLSTQLLLRRIRAVTDAPIIVMKGPETARRWPTPQLRPWMDLDILVADADGLQAALIAAGFVEVDDRETYEDLHHPPPLLLPGMPMTVEVHRRPHWPSDDAPSFEELLEAAVPMGLSVPDVFAPDPAQNAVLLAAHAWGHEPLSRVGPLADVAAAMLAAGRENVEAVAQRWGVRRVWLATARAIDDLLLSPSGRPRLWHRHLHDARERTVFESHVQRVMGAVAEGPIAAAPVAATRAAWATVRPARGERWSRKIVRSRAAVRNASVRESEHYQELVTRNST
jgi:hypothetical protein